MKKPGNILIVDDNRGVLTAVQLLLKPHFEKIITLTSPVTLTSVLREETPSVVLLDMNFTSGINTGNEGLFWLQEIKRLRPSLPVVLFTAYGDIDLAVRGIKEGATDFIVKPWDNQKLVETLLNAAQAIHNKNNGKNASPVTPAMYWGESPIMQQLRSLVEKVAITDANILITGENGTGKEMLAREIHALSSRRTKEMIAVDMGAITESLFESELFGHTKGSFTDAYADRPGKFETADHSTLFLDDEMVQRNEFREDLLYRINTIHLEIPPLRERPEDILPLAERFITRFCKQYDKALLRLSDAACTKLKTHPWYGNIRELEHAIEKAVIICDGNELPAELFQLPKRPETSRTGSDAGTEAATLEEMERKMIQKALDTCNGNLSAVAAQLGITRQTLYNKMKKFGL